MNGSPQTSRVERKRRERRRHILDVAARLFAAEGLSSLTLGKLARELDYTPGALYRYFDSKDALIAELEVRALERIAERFEDMRAGWMDYPPLRDAPETEARLFCLYALACFYVDLLDEIPQEIHLISMLMGDHRNLVGDADTERVRPTLTSLLTLVAGLMHQAAEAGALEPGRADERTVIYWSSVQGIVQMDKLRRFQGDLFNPRARGPETARALLLGWGADPAALHRAVDLASTWRKECSQPSH